MANWSIYKAKEELTATSRKYGIKVIFLIQGLPPVVVENTQVLRPLGQRSKITKYKSQYEGHKFKELRIV
jgi:hypothetical protein